MFQEICTVIHIFSEFLRDCANILSRSICPTTSKTAVFTIEFTHSEVGSIMKYKTKSIKINSLKMRKKTAINYHY